MTIYERLFGTPERAAELLGWIDQIDTCEYMDTVHDGASVPEKCVGCMFEYDLYGCERTDMTVLEWLRQDVEA